jgi:signal transduction histidine kinase
VRGVVEAPAPGAGSMGETRRMQEEAAVRPDVSSPRSSRPATPAVLFGVTVVLSLLSVFLLVVAWSHLDPSDAIPAPALAIAAPFFGFLGYLILRRTTNTIGWLLLAEGVANALMLVTSLYAVIAAARGLPGYEVVGAVSEVVFVPLVMGLAFVLLLFPTGRLPSARWRPVAIAILIATAVVFVGFIVTPRDVALPAPGGVSLLYPNPFAIETFRGTEVGTITGLSLVTIVAFGAAVVALVVRFRSGDVERREQIEWVAFAAGLFVLAQIALTIAIATVGNGAGITTAIGFASALLALFGFPSAIAIAILKHRLFEIDVLINRTVLYGIVAAVITVVYAAIVAGVGALVGVHGGPVLTITAAVAVALLFQPLRSRARMIANRLVYGERATPYEVLSAFADQMAMSVPLDEQLDTLVTVLANGVGASRVEVRAETSAGERPIAAWPVAMSDGADGAVTTVPVRQGDELLGSVDVTKPVNEPLTPVEAALLEHVASQAGMLLRNLRLTTELRATIDELQASRRRLVEAQDSERRRIERNIHDGAQQQLVALGVKLSLAQRILRGDVDAADRMLEELRGEATQALDDLRELARGIYPPLLADRGLVEAVQAQARKAPFRVDVETVGEIGRQPQEVEAAVYFCVLEALQNIAKYAKATRATVRLTVAAGALVFVVTDDGDGFDATATSYGTGLQGMTDRLGALGGALTVTSAPASGTTVNGAVPLHATPSDR